jgi:hypothetical protein
MTRAHEAKAHDVKTQNSKTIDAKGSFDLDIAFVQTSALMRNG